MLAYWVSMVAIFGAILTTFGWLDARAPKPVKEAVRDWAVPDPEAADSAAWTDAFLALFNAVFAERAMSWRFIWRSCLTSLTVSVSIFVITVLIAVENDSDLASASAIAWTIAWAAVFAVFFNFLPDYLSLIESRWVIKKIDFHRKSYRTIALLAFDAVFTSLIFLTPVILVMSVGAWFLFSISGAQMDLLEALKVVLDTLIKNNSPDSPPFRLLLFPFFCSTFVTSVWVWLFIVGGYVVRSKKPLLRAVRAPLALIDVKKYPLSAIGLAAGWVFTWCYLAAGGVYLVIS